MSALMPMGGKDHGDHAEYAEKKPRGEPPKNLASLVPFFIGYDHAGDTTPGAHHKNEHPARQVHHISNDALILARLCCTSPPVGKQ